MFLQKSNDLLQHGGLVHFPSVAWEHGAELFDEDIELVPALLLRLVSRGSGNTQGTGKKNIPLCEGSVMQQRCLLSQSSSYREHPIKVSHGGSVGHCSELSNGARNMFC